MIEAHVPVDDREARSVQHFLAELDRLDNPFDRDDDPVHVTSSAIVIGRRGVLLHWHKRVGGWLQPGGHLDHGERPDVAAVREVMEETGVRAEHCRTGPYLVHLDVHSAAAGHTHLDLRYLLIAPKADEPAPAANESQDVKWFTLQGSRKVADPALIGALHALAAKRLPTDARRTFRRYVDAGG